MTRRGRNEGTIFLRSDGRWAGSLELGWVDGRRRRKTVYGSTRREVATKLRAVERLVTDGVAPPSDRLTVVAYLADWLEAARPHIRPSTYSSYADITRLHLVPSIGRIALGKLSVGDVERMMRAKLATGLSPRRVAMIRAVLRRALGRAVKHRLVVANVASLADAPRQEQRELEPFNPAEAREFLAAIRGHRFEAAFVTALMTGLRSGELRGLEWGDVNLDSKTITVRRALQRIEGHWQRVEPKSRAGRRVIPLAPMAAEILAWYRLAQARERELLGAEWVGSDFDLVFTTRIGTPIDGSNIGHAFQAALASAGLRHVRLHDLRHSAATFWMAAGIPARVVADMLGHSQVGLTLNVYSHVLPELREDAASAMQAILGPRTEPIERSV